LSACATFDRLSGMLARADEEDLNLTIRPHPLPVTHPIALLRLDEVNAEWLARVRPYAFLVLATSAEAYQCWLAVAKADPRSATLWRRLGATAQTGGAAAVRIAGSKIASLEARPANGDYPRVSLIDGCVGLLHPLWTLEEQGLLPLLRNSVLA